MCLNRNLIIIYYCCLYNKIYAANFDTTDGTGVGADEENDRNVIGPAFARGKLNRVLVRQSYLILSYLISSFDAHLLSQLWSHFLNRSQKYAKIMFMSC